MTRVFTINTPWCRMPTYPPLGAAAQADTFVTLSNGSVITIGSGASSGTVSVAARTDDSYDQGTTTVTASISSATGGNFETLTVSGGAASTTVVDDEDATSVSLAATGGGTEGQSITYTATLVAGSSPSPLSTHHATAPQHRADGCAALGPCADDAQLPITGSPPIAGYAPTRLQARHAEIDRLPWWRIGSYHPEGLQRDLTLRTGLQGKVHPISYHEFEVV